MYSAVLIFALGCDCNIAPLLPPLPSTGCNNAAAVFCCSSVRTFFAVALHTYQRSMATLATRCVLRRAASNSANAAAVPCAGTCQQRFRRVYANYHNRQQTAPYQRQQRLQRQRQRVLRVRGNTCQPAAGRWPFCQRNRIPQQQRRFQQTLPRLLCWHNSGNSVIATGRLYAGSRNRKSASPTDAANTSKRRSFADNMHMCSLLRCLCSQHNGMGQLRLPGSHNASGISCAGFAFFVSFCQQFISSPPYSLWPATQHGSSRRLSPGSVLSYTNAGRACRHAFAWQRFC